MSKLCTYLWEDNLNRNLNIDEVPTRLGKKDIQGTNV
jgi:hypothetical protein